MGTTPKTALVLNADWKEGGAIRNCLESCGYVATAWTSTEDALGTLSAHPWSLVVLSTNIGTALDGFLKSLLSTKPHPKILLIADKDDGDPSKRGFPQTTEVINRPFQLGDLADRADHLITNG